MIHSIKVKLVEPIDGYEEIATWGFPKTDSEFLWVNNKVCKHSKLSMEQPVIILTPIKKRLDWDKVDGYEYP